MSKESNQVSKKEDKKEDKKETTGVKRVVEDETETENVSESESESESVNEQRTKKQTSKDKDTKYETEDETEDESDDEENEEKLKIKLLKNLKYDFESYEIKYIYETYLKDETVNLTPPYQREFAWDSKKQDLFIDSIMNNFIIPPIILIKLNDKKGYRYECMDGQHRLTVLKNFIEGRSINPDDLHYIRFNKTEDDKKVSVYYEKKKRLEKLKDKRYMTDKEKNVFNEKKIIVIKITNYDPKLIDLFGTIKNEMFLRLQKGEKASGTDVMRNCEHPLIIEMKKLGLISYKTYDEESEDDNDEDVNKESNKETSQVNRETNKVNRETNKVNRETNKETNKIKKLKDIMAFKTKKRAQRLTQLLMFNLKAILVIKYQSLDIGNITDTNIRDSILNNKTPRFILKTGQKWSQFIKTLDDFIKVIYDGINENELKVNQYLLLTLLYLYVSSKDKFNEKLKSIDKYVEKYDDKYFSNLFTLKVDSKIKKCFEGKKLEALYKIL